MKNRSLISLPLLLLLLFVAACSLRPDDIIDKDTMSAILADLHKAEGVLQSSNRAYHSDSMKRVFRQSIFAKHGVTSDQVYNSLDWYGYHIEQLDEIYSGTIDILNAELDDARADIGSAAELDAVANMSIDGDSVDVWPTVRSRRFAATMPSDYLRFDIANDRYWDRGDVYILRAKIVDADRPVTCVLAADYFDGTTEYITRPMGGNGWREIGIALDSAKVARSVYGYIHYATVGDDVAYVDSLSLMRTRWGGHYRYLRTPMKSVKFK